ncbi:NAD(P)-binding Rossmann-fold superfamily protein [Forsythia ovata]|uniref:NAD(P)-binding Rossmann-fold superfamily protein n=1 Tax=Forsythia ovata TaxID=205694 RepID=A0ABD1T3A0_9LAMI
MAPTKEEEEIRNKCVAVIFGSTGLVGKELAIKLLSTGKWKVYGIARRAEINMIKHPNYHFISCDLLNPFETQEKLCSLRDVTNLFWVTWASQFPLDTQECCEQNKWMMCNALDAILPRAKALRHVSLQTGAKHYVSLQQEDSKDDDDVYYYNEECPRVTTGNNFYYVLEDLLQERLGSGKVTWSVHRPGLLMGSSHRTLFNFIGSLCVYGTICNRLNLPFVFGGSRECWEEMYVDASDARLVAEQHIWAATQNIGEAFNAVNGDSYTWKEIWGAIGVKLGVNSTLFGPDLRYSLAMSDMGGLWKEIVMKEGLVETEMEDLANWEFLDNLFRCPVKMLGSREKADCLGFMIKYQTLDSIMYWIDVMRQDKLIP